MDHTSDLCASTSSLRVSDQRAALLAERVVSIVSLDLEVQTDVDQAEKEDDDTSNEAVELAKRDHTHTNAAPEHHSIV